MKQDRRDQLAWEAFYDQAWPLALATVARQLGRTDSQVEDCAQETFYRLLKYCDFKTLNDAAALRGYLVTTAKNSAHTWQRRMGSSPLHAHDVERVDEQSLAADASDAESIAMAKELWERGVLPRLDDIDREIVEGLIDGRSIAELAGTTGLTYTAVGVRLHRLRQRLGKSL